MTRVTMIPAVRWVSAVLGFLLGGCIEETAPTARSQGKAMATGDTAASSAWQPGDEIPGWEDYDCPQREGAGYLDLLLPTPVYVGWGDAIVRGDAAGTFDGVYYQGLYADCVTGACDYTGGDPSTIDNTSWVEVQFSRYDRSVSDRGQGEYDFLHGHGEAPRSKGHTELLQWRAVGDAGIDNVMASVCVSRLRPDQIAWVMEVLPASPSRGGGPYFAWYEQWVLRVQFTATFPDHGGCYTDFSDPYNCVPDLGESQIGYDDISYDDAWPWDEITDPDIRDAVYERYTPWNTP